MWREGVFLIDHGMSEREVLLEMWVDSIAACEAAIDALTITEIDQWTTSNKPLRFPPKAQA